VTKLETRVIIEHSREQHYVGIFTANGVFVNSLA